MVNTQYPLKIIEITADNIVDVNKTDTTHEINSRIVPYIKDGVFNYTVEEIYPSCMKTYEEDNIAYSTYINNPAKVVFLAYINEKPAGQIVLRKNWNNFAYIEDIRVSSNFLSRGTGIALLEKAEEWAIAGGMPGIMLETQDVNVSACKLYEKAGFILGGVEKNLYSVKKNYEHETALFWYKVF